jgi:lysophospholipase L1-like esterase
MMELQPQAGPQQKKHWNVFPKNSFAWKCGLGAVLFAFLSVGWAAAFAAEKPTKPVAKKSAGRHVVATYGQAGKAGRANGRYSASSRATSHGRRSGSRYASVPFRPKYSVARPVQEFHTFVRQSPVPEQSYPATAVPETTAVTEAPVPSTGNTEVQDAMLAVPPAQPFFNVHALDSFFRALTAQQAQKASGTQSADVAGPPIVRVLQFGDSHTAADIFTGEMRADIQARFGNGGLGFQYPGHPFAGYRLLGSSRSQTSGWETQGNRFTELGDGDTGLGGIAISTSRPGESVTVSTTCETLEVQYLRQPGGGTLDFSDNGLPVAQIKTATDVADDPGVDPSAGVNVARGAGTFTYSCTPGVHEFQLITTASAPVRLLGLVTEQAGVTYECLGINGAVAPLMLRWNQQMFADYLGQRNPDLIVLAYGTNEAAGSPSHNEEYAAEFHQLLQNLHRIVPGASILVLGPYDRALKVGRGRHASWSTTYAIDRIIADQRAACRVDNCAFYDQRARMGGPGAMMHWVANAYAQGDHTHLTGTGYRVLADALYRDLMSVYNSYLQTLGTGGQPAPGPPVSQPKTSTDPAS